MPRKRKIVFGFGINDAPYDTYKSVGGKIVWQCPFHRVWKGMMARCYNEVSRASTPSYKNCSICDDWVYFMNFRAWMEKQDWEGKHLDKDIILEGNKVYSPETCIFVSGALNSFVLDSSKQRGNYPIGVYLDSYTNRLKAQCGTGDNGCKNLGRYDCPHEAHENWRSYKEMMANRYADELERDHPNNPKYKQAADALRLRYSYDHWYRDFEGELPEDLTGKYPDPKLNHKSH